LNIEVVLGKGWDLSADVARLEGAVCFDSRIRAEGDLGHRLGGQRVEEAVAEGRKVASLRHSAP